MHPDRVKRPGNSAGNSVQHVSCIPKPPLRNSKRADLCNKNAGNRRGFPEKPAVVSKRRRDRPKKRTDPDKSEDNMVNKVRVTIAGAPYAIATTDPEAYITSLAKKLDEDITKLLDDNANLSVTKAAVFCAMDYLDEYRKSTGSAENMRSQIQDYIADATRAKLAEDKVKAENEVLRREAAALREQLEKMRNKEARREERAQQAAQRSVAEGEADKAE